MGTVTLTTTDLVDRIAERCDATSARQVAAELDVSPSTVTNWRRGTDMVLTRSLQLRLAVLLGETPTEVLRLHGYDVSDTVPAATVSSEMPRHPYLYLVGDSKGRQTDERYGRSVALLAV